MNEGKMVDASFTTAPRQHTRREQSHQRGPLLRTLERAAQQTKAERCRRPMDAKERCCLLCLQEPHKGRRKKEAD